MQRTPVRFVLTLVSLIGSLSACTSVPEQPAAPGRRNPLQGLSFYHQQDSDALRVAADPRVKEAVATISAQPAAIWLGAWTGPIRPAIEKQVAAADAAGSHLLLVPYNVPYRDCGQHSAGGIEAGAYRKWIDDLALGLGQHRAVVILEPDAIALIDCLSPELRAERWQLIHDALTVLKSKTRALVYLDVGHGNWIPAGIMAERLRAIGIDAADGFAINTSNYQANADNERYGRQLVKEFPGKGYVIDTSRNGRGPSADQAWCNPRGRSLGAFPEVLKQPGGADAYLWVKRPGESDGTCNGGPKAGTFWPEIAVELVENSKKR